MNEHKPDTPSLTRARRRELIAAGHSLTPVVIVGKSGITDALVEAASQALDDHELIKIRILRTAPEERAETAAVLAQRTGAALLKVTGRTALLYRPAPPRDEKPDRAAARSRRERQ